MSNGNETSERTGQEGDVRGIQVGDTVWTRLPGETDISEGAVMDMADDIGGRRAYVCGPIGDDCSIGFAMWIGVESLAVAPGERAPTAEPEARAATDPQAYLDTPLTAEERVLAGIACCEDCGNYGPDVLMRSPIDPAHGGPMAICQSCWYANAAQYLAQRLARVVRRTGGTRY